MTDEAQTTTEQTSDDAAFELAMLDDLKAKAKLMGVSFHPTIGYEKLSEKIKEHVAAQEAASVSLTKEPEVTEQAPVAAKSKGQLIKEMRDEATKLIRVNVMCLNPAKRQWNGEIITIGNSNLPTQRKFIPFNTPDGYHIPNIMLTMLKEREFQVFYDEQVKTAMGVQTVRRSRRDKEFNIVELPQLTEKELKELARVQAAAAGLE
jgi:hypothetical protein